MPHKLSEICATLTPATTSSKSGTSNNNNSNSNSNKGTSPCLHSLYSSEHMTLVRYRYSRMVCDGYTDLIFVYMS